MLTDGDGFRTAFDWRGWASLLPCFKHWNVLKKDLCVSLSDVLLMTESLQGPLRQHIYCRCATAAQKPPHLCFKLGEFRAEVAPFDRSTQG